MTRLIGKLLIGVAGGVAVWFLTQSPYSPFTGPDVKLTAPTVPNAMAAGDEFRVSYAVTNQRNRPETGCGSYVSLDRIGDVSFSSEESGDQAPQPPQPPGTATRPELATRPEIVMRPQIGTRAQLSVPSISVQQALSAPPEARQFSELSEPELREITQARRVPRITKEPMITERAVAPEPDEERLERAECRTGGREFELNGTAGSSIQVLANCRADMPGTFRMTYGVSCEKSWGGQWNLQGEAHVDIEEG